MNLYHYEFKEEEIDCQCQRCVQLNITEERNFMLSEEAEENEKRLEYLNEFSREVTAARKEVDVLIKENEEIGARIQQNRADIIAFGEKRLTNI